MTSPTPEFASATAIAAGVQPISLAAYMNAQARITRAMNTLGVSAIRRFGLPESLPEQKAMAARIYPHVEKARAQSYVLSVRHMQGQAPYVPRAPIRSYEPDAVERAVADVVEAARKPRVRVKVADATAMDQKSRKSRVRVRVQDDLGARLARHAHQAGRDAAVDTADRAGDSVGWARVLSGAENCAWCVMLSSRGPVYRSEQSASTASGKRGNRAAGESYHDNCDCEAVLVQQGSDWDGRERYELAEELWLTATRGFSGKHALNALRRQLDRAERENLTHQELLDALRAE